MTDFELVTAADVRCQGVSQTTAYRGDLHILVEAPDATMASSTIMWLDEANKTAG